jgi:hypothetical protein
MLHILCRRVAKSVAFRQLVVITVAIGIVRFGLPAVLKAMAKFSSTSVQWDKTTLYYILREVHQPEHSFQHEHGVGARWVAVVVC